MITNRTPLIQFLDGNTWKWLFARKGETNQPIAAKDFHNAQRAPGIEHFRRVLPRYQFRIMRHAELEYQFRVHGAVVNA